MTYKMDDLINGSLAIEALEKMQREH